MSVQGLHDYLERWRKAAPSTAMVEPAVRQAVRRGAAMSTRAGRSASVTVTSTPRKVTVTARGPGAGLVLAETRKHLASVPRALREEVVKAVTRR